ncbi:MAG: ATP-binding cassette domain-containing protein, partial [Ignavibacteriales bacterium]
MIKVNNLSHVYNNCDQPSLRSINTVLNEGEYTALIGPNGCGKTTLIRHLNALLNPSAGEVEVDGMSTRSRQH